MAIPTATPTDTNMIDSPSFFTRTEDGVAVLTINRPDVHNAFDDTLIAALHAEFVRIDADPAARVLLLRSTGKSFCAGADLNWMRRTAGYTREQNMADAAVLAAMLETLAGMSKPTVAKVHGAAFGGGAGLVACCDVAIASVEATFSFSEVRLGLIPATISPFVLKAIGARAAMRLFLTGERFDAEAALHVGLVQQITEVDALMPTTHELCVRIANYGPQTLHAIKTLVRDVAGREIDRTLLDETARRIADQRVSREGVEGIAAFLEKRAPNWGTATS